MLIDFNKIAEVTETGVRGGEGDMILRKSGDGLAKINFGRLQPGAYTGLHTHETNSEIIYIISGEADFIYDDGTEKAVAGQCHYCPKGHSHSMKNNGNEELVFFAVLPEHP